MAKDTLSASLEGIEKIKATLKQKGKTQSQLANGIYCSRETISSLLRGNNIEKETLKKVCNELNLDLYKIVKQKYVLPDLVTQLRQLLKADIETRCGTMRIFDMSQPIELGKIYTSVNILEKITSYQRRDIKALLQTCNITDLDRFNFGAVIEERISGKEAVSRHKKLLIIGKPGAGKTTFLKHIAIECIKEKFQEDLVPFFVILKEFAETEPQKGLLTYLKNYLTKSDRDNLKTVLKNGKALILLDGLDEVLEADTKRVIKEIETFSNRYPNNQFLMTCRIAAKEYLFEKFTEVEIADFNDEQIATFAQNWFKGKPVKPEAFLMQLEKDKPIKELVSNPLLLILLCIFFEELGDFSANRKELYKEGVKALLDKWDIKRGIQRDEVYKPFFITQKENLLSKIAWETFTSADYFFKQDKAKIFINEYISNLPGVNLDDEALQGDSDKVLKNIEAQHGLLVQRAKNIYSFSHLTFQEYFTAREIITVRQSSNGALQELVSHLFEPRWREVFLLAVAMSPNAERLALLMKEQIDNLLTEDENLQTYLWWLNEKTKKENIKFQSEDKKILSKVTNYYINLDLSLSRVFYFNLDFTLNLFLFQNENFDLYPYLNQNRNHYPYKNENLNLYLNLYRNLNRNIELYLNLYLYKNENRNLYLNLYRNLNQNVQSIQEYDSELHLMILKLQKLLPHQDNTSKENLKNWWKTNGKDWIDDFRQAMIKYRNIGYDWQFNEVQKTKLKQYYRANQLLTQCLHQECVVSSEVRQYIEETLLLPIAEIKPFSPEVRQYIEETLLLPIAEIKPFSS